ncbi:MAG: hypothetical protein IJM85_00135 [Clostridia bacterium]|nr:hypothetical protein [Clostridia bacterium]
MKIMLFKARGRAALLALLILVFAFSACSMRENGSKPSPTAGAGTNEPAVTLRPTEEASASPDVGASPDVSGSPEVSDSPEVSGSPDASGSPDVSGSPRLAISDFMQGRVVDPADVPELAALIGREFPEHAIQSVTEEFWRELPAYRVTLQSRGELSRVLFVLEDGSIVLSGMD